MEIVPSDPRMILGLKCRWMPMNIFDSGLRIFRFVETHWVAPRALARKKKQLNVFSKSVTWNQCDADKVSASTVDWWHWWHYLWLYIAYLKNTQSMIDYVPEELL